MQKEKKNVVRSSPPEASFPGKKPPASIEAERAVLGAILLNDAIMTTVSEILTSEQFYLPAHQTMYRAMHALLMQHKRIDLVTLQDYLFVENALDAVGGTEYLIGLQEDIPAVGMAQQHAQIIKEKATFRELIQSASTIIENCYSQNEVGIDMVLDQAEKTIFDIANKRARNSFVQIDIWLKKTFQYLSNMKTSSKGVTGIPTLYKKFDTMTSGFQNGDLIVLAARPSMGKTALSLCFGSKAAKGGYSVGIFSLEMSAEQLTLRLLSMESGIPHHLIRNASISSQEWLKLTTTAGKVSELSIFIDDTAMLDITELRSKARKLKSEHNVQMIIVDYLQLLHSAKKHENRHQEVSEISRSLKALAKELHIPIIALSQLSRAVDSRMDKRPMLSDLRESGAIEQDADVIVFLYRDIVYNKDAENPALSELIIGKQRNGPTGTVFLNFERELTRFDDVEVEPEYS